MAALINCNYHGITYERECPECKKYPYDPHFTNKQQYGSADKSVTSAYRPMDERDLRPVLRDFAVEMEKKLRKNDYKTGWRDLPIEAIKKLLYIELQELEVAMEFFSIEEARKELIDCGNYCMILYDRLGMEEDKNNGATK